MKVFQFLFKRKRLTAIFRFQESICLASCIIFFLIIRYLTFRSFLELYEESEEGSVEVKTVVREMILESLRNVEGGSLKGKTLSEELNWLDHLPDSVYCEKTVLHDVLNDLDRTAIGYLSPEKMSPFFGRV